MYDLILKGGRVLDPSSKLDGAQDVAVTAGKIARIAPGIDAKEGDADDRRGGPRRGAGAHRSPRARVRGREPHGRRSGSRRRARGRHHGRGRGQRGRGDVRRLPAARHPEFPHRGPAVPPHLPDRARDESRHHRGEQHRPRRHAARAGGAQGPHPRDQGAHGVARARDHGHADAGARQARGARERHPAHGAHRRHHEALRPDRHPEAPADARQGRHPHALLHGESRRRARRERQAGARGARGRGSRRVARHRARAHELQLRRRAPLHRPGPAPALHQHRPHRARPRPHRALDGRDHDALPRARLLAARRGHDVDGESGARARRGRAARQPRGRPAGRHLGARDPRRRVDGERRASARACA